MDKHADQISQDEAMGQVFTSLRAKSPKHPFSGHHEGGRWQSISRKTLGTAGKHLVGSDNLKGVLGFS